MVLEGRDVIGILASAICQFNYGFPPYWPSHEKRPPLRADEEIAPSLREGYAETLFWAQQRRLITPVQRERITAMLREWEEYGCKTLRVLIEEIIGNIDYAREA